MATSVRTKAAKKQPGFDALKTADAGQGMAQPDVDESNETDPRLARAVLRLEDACFAVLDDHPEAVAFDHETREQAGQLKNIATPLSLALRECKGPRRFHYHYRHDPEDYDTLTPVAGPSPYATLARVCRQALRRLDDFHMVDDPAVRRDLHQLQMAVQDYLRLLKA